MQDWRNAIFNNPSHSFTYKMGNSTVRLQSRLVLGLLLAGAVIVLYLMLQRGSSGMATPNVWETASQSRCNSTYPSSRPLLGRGSGGGIARYRFAVITDLDQASRRDSGWVSLLRHGWLEWQEGNGGTPSASVHWDKPDVTVKSALANGGRAMELSELVSFGGHLLSVDDRTGVVYRLSEGRAVPWLILADGDGDVAKGFKGEWMTVKDNHLYIGGLGKEWTTSKGEVLNHDPQFVKRVTCDGRVEHIDWQPVYRGLVSAAGLTPPGYLIHEAVVWSDARKEWMFLPRRASNEKYDDVADERRGTNILIRADETFSNFKKTEVGPIIPTHGFSSFKFIPHTDDQWIVALKSEEDSAANRTNSYITVFSVDGQVALEETPLEGHMKFEGIEFV